MDNGQRAVVALLRELFTPFGLKGTVYHSGDEVKRTNWTVNDPFNPAVIIEHQGSKLNIIAPGPGASWKVDLADPGAGDRITDLMNKVFALRGKRKRRKT
jgi:hypothetical protein